MSEQHSAEKDARPVCNCAPDCAERIACEKVGEVGHLACGWCETHGQANHICMCLIRNPVTATRPTPPEEPQP